MRVLFLTFIACVLSARFASGVNVLSSHKNTQSEIQNTMLQSTEVLDLINNYNVIENFETKVAKSVVESTIKSMTGSSIDKEAEIKHLLLLLALKDSLDGVKDEGMLGTVEKMLPKYAGEMETSYPTSTASDDDSDKELGLLLLLLALGEHVDGSYAGDDLVKDMFKDIPVDKMMEEYDEEVDYDKEILKLLWLVKLKFQMEMNMTFPPGFNETTYAPTMAIENATDAPTIAIENATEPMEYENETTANVTDSLASTSIRGDDGNSAPKTCYFWSILIFLPIYLSL